MMVSVLRGQEAADSVTFSVIVPVHNTAALVRTVRGCRQVALPLPLLPAAVALGWLYHALSVAGEIGTFANLPSIRRIRI